MEERVTKICPMRPVISADDESGRVTFYKCEREECAWWVDETEDCGIVAIAKWMPAISKVK